MKNIKSGDKVVFIGSDEIFLEIGKTYTVGRVYSEKFVNYFEILDTNYDIFSDNMNKYFLTISEYRYKKLSKLEDAENR